MTKDMKEQEKQADKSKRKTVVAPYTDKYQAIGFFSAILSEEFYYMFDLIRNFPPVLKLVIYGKKDSLFQVQLLNEKAVFYSYVKSLPQEDEEIYRKKLLETYGDFFKGKNIENVQSRFVFCLPFGKHSIHFQKRNHDFLRKSVYEYLRFVIEKNKH